jgi:hypothetical protein
MKRLKLSLVYKMLLVLSLSSCKNDYYDFRLKVVNNSNKSIYADYYQSYPDTTLAANSKFGNFDKKVNPNGTITLGRGGTWERAFKEDIQQKILVFIFDASIVENTPWDTIRSKYLVLKRYDLTLKDLDSLNFKAAYP